MKKVFLTVCGILIATNAFAQQAVPQAPLPTSAPPVPQEKQAAPQSVASPPPQPPVVNIPQMDDETAEALGNMRAFLNHDFDGQLDFPLTEEKMIAFIRIASKIEKVNSKWDVQIAGAETDQMAIEYNNFAAEEMAKVVKKMTGLTQEEYTQMVKLSVSSADFSSLYGAYKQLVAEGYFGPDLSVMEEETEVKKTVKRPPPAMTAPAPDVPAAPPRKGDDKSKSPAKTADPGKASALQGSPAPPYSPPAGR